MKRYDIVSEDPGCVVIKEESPDGSWVDHDEAIQEIGKLKAQIDILYTVLKRYEPWREKEPNIQDNALFFGKNIDYWFKAQLYYEERMTIEKAREILGNMGENVFRDEGDLYSLGRYLSWDLGSPTAVLDGSFSPDELEAIIFWMRENHE